MDRGAESNLSPAWGYRIRGALLAAGILVGAACGDGGETANNRPPTVESSTEDLQRTLKKLDCDKFDYSAGIGRVIVNGVTWHIGPGIEECKPTEYFFWFRDPEELKNPVYYEMDSEGTITKNEMIEKTGRGGYNIIPGGDTAVTSPEEIEQLRLITEQLRRQAN